MHQFWNVHQQVKVLTKNCSSNFKKVLLGCLVFCTGLQAMRQEQAELGHAGSSKQVRCIREIIYRAEHPAQSRPSLCAYAVGTGRSICASELCAEPQPSMPDNNGQAQRIDEERERVFNGAESYLSANGLNGVEDVLPAFTWSQPATATRLPRFCNFLPATARTVTQLIGAARGTSNLWAPVLRLALYNRYGQTQAYKVGNVLLNTANTVLEIKEGQYHSIPSSIIDSLYQLGYLSQVKKTIKRHTGLSMTDISGSLFYNAILFGLFLKSSQSAVGKICFSLYEIPSLFTNGMNTQFFRPFDRLVAFQRGISASLEYMQKKAQQFSQLLSTRQQVAEQDESVQALGLIATA